MEGNLQRPRQFYQPSCALNVHVAVGIENAEHNAISSETLRHSNAPSHDLELICVVTETPAPRRNHNLNPNGDSLSPLFDHPRAGRDPALEQIAAQLDPLCSATLRSH